MHSMGSWSKRASLTAMALTSLVLLLLASLAANTAPVTVRFYYRGGDLRDKQVEEWIAAFERQNPAIHVEWDMPGSDWDEKLLVAMGAGVAPDVTECWGDFAQYLARSGALLDLRPFVQRDMTRADIADFFPPSWETSILQFGANAGLQFAMPRYINTIVFYYNSDLFAQAGLETPDILDNRDAWTWDALRDAAKKLTRHDGGKVVQYGLTTDTNDWNRTSQYLWAAGGDWFDVGNPRRYTGDQSGARRGISFLYDMIWGDESTTSKRQWRQFAEGSVAMLDDGIHALFSRIQPQVGDRFSFNIARRPAGAHGRKPIIYDDSLAIWSGSKHPEEAWAFLKFVTSRAGQEIMMRHERLAPTRRSVAAAYVGLDPTLNLKAFVDNVAEARLPLATRVAGDTRRIGGEINGMLDRSLVKNQIPFDQAALAIRPVIEAIVAESAY